MPSTFRTIVPASVARRLGTTVSALAFPAAAWN